MALSNPLIHMHGLDSTHCYLRRSGQFIVSVRIGKVIHLTTNPITSVDSRASVFPSPRTVQPRSAPQDQPRKPADWRRLSLNPCFQERHHARKEIWWIVSLLFTFNCQSNTCYINQFGQRWVRSLDNISDTIHFQDLGIWRLLPGNDPSKVPPVGDSVKEPLALHVIMSHT